MSREGSASKLANNPKGTVRGFEHDFALEDANRFPPLLCSLEARMRVAE
jgi:hypothetical protein